jgi:cardiolipin synthase
MGGIAHYFDTFYVSYFSLVLLAFSVAAAVHILLNKHDEPVSTVLWLFVVFSLPLAGMVFYLFFGINRLQTRGLRIRMANELMTGQRNDPMHRGLAAHLAEQRRHTLSAAHPAYGEYQRVLDRLLPDTVPLDGNQVELLEDGTVAYPRMLAEIRAARQTIHLQSFIFMNDPAGEMLLAALAERARAGVRVKVLYDRFGSFATMFSMFFRRFSSNQPNLAIRSFSQFNLRAPWRVQLRNHRKVLVIDGRIAFTGGINISRDNDVNLSRKPRHIHDLHCLIRGPAVGELQFSFLRDWHYVSGVPPSELFREEHFPVLERAGNTAVRVVASGPGQEYEATAKVFHTAASTARQSLWIINPYFVPDRTFWMALGMAVARGVEVRIIVPEKNNHWYVRHATRSLYSHLLPRGVRIFEKCGVFSHAKAMLVDNAWAYMGSSNCDVRSFRLNYELDFAAAEGDFIAVLREQFMAEFRESREVDLAEVEHAPLPRRLLENFCSLLTPVL